MTLEVISSNDIDTLQNRLTSSADKRKLDNYENIAQEAKSI